MKAIVVGLALLVVGCGGEYPQSTLHPTADLGESIDVLYRTIFWWAVGVFVVVEGALLYVIVRFRERPDTPAPAHLHGSTVLEIAWTLAPVVVLVFIAVPTIQTIFETDADAPSGALTVEVVGHQWWWEYRYPELEVVTANEMHIPRGRTVALEMISADVIHSFWAPKLGGKRDVIPGRTTRLFFTADSTGTFMGQCAEFCGDSHTNMGLRVVVQDSADFAIWAQAQHAGPPPADSLSPAARRGLELYQQVRQPADHSCILCHRVAGVSGGTLGPDLTHVASRGTIAAGMLPNDSASLALWLADPPGIKPGSLMPDIALTEDETAALVAYLRSLR
jgi:cytochrome c oxidase subunit 2